MSRIPPLQKPLGWVQRYLYNIEQGPLPTPQPVLNIDWDWPLEYKLLRDNSVTIAGTQGVELYRPDNEHHGLVIFAVLDSTPGPFVNTDYCFVRLVEQSGLTAINVGFWNGVQSIYIPLVGAAANFMGGAGNSTLIPAVYVPPGWFLDFQLTSVAGGVNFNIRGAVLERLKSYPLRLP